LHAFDDGLQMLQQRRAGSQLHSAVTQHYWNVPMWRNGVITTLACIQLWPSNAATASRNTACRALRLHLIFSPHDINNVAEHSLEARMCGVCLLPQVRTFAADLTHRPSLGALLQHVGCGSSSSRNESSSSTNTSSNSSPIQISLLVANAGGAVPRFASYWQFSAEEEAAMQALNGTACYVLVQQLLPGMVQVRKPEVHYTQGDAPNIY
jgi:NAD(P)-dependent dehydrogenase (short-subunit alcohol dehydrogenase family)